MRCLETSGAPRRTVLVVDDDPASQMYLTDALEALGCRVVQAGDGSTALQVLTQRLPDLVCTDFMMPGMDGVEFLQVVRAQAPQLPMVLVTACDRAEVAAEAARLGITRVLRKPVSLGDLAAILDRLPRGAGDPPPARLAGPAPPGARAERAGSPPPPSPAAVRLEPALLRKTTQLSFLTRFGSTLRAAWAWAPEGPSARLASLGADPGSVSRVLQAPALEPLINQSLDVILRAMPGERAALVLTEGERLEVAAARGTGPEALPVPAVAVGLRAEPEGQPWRGAPDGGPVVAAPLVLQGTRAGFVCVGRSGGGHPFTWADAELLSAFVAQTAVTLENAALRWRLERALQETVRSLVVALEAKHKYTEGHSQRVAEYATGIAAGLGLGPIPCERVHTASLLHDLGKVGVRDAILDKPGRLSPEEWAAMRMHPALGARILEPLGFLAEEARIVRHHHEWYDGTGYPDGLAGDRIPQLARVITVADAFDAMRSTRPYRLPLPLEAALAQLGCGAGRQFDPEIVAAFRAWLGARDGSGKIL